MLPGSVLLLALRRIGHKMYNSHIILFNQLVKASS
jgi:hypothetical protein